MYQAAMKQPKNKDFFLKCTIGIYSRVWKNAAKTSYQIFLTGHLSQPASESDQGTVSGAPLHNISSERDFGTLDASQQRRRNATLHYHTSMLLLKSNRDRFGQWLDGKNDRERHSLFKNARKKGLALRKCHREFDVNTNLEIEKNIQEETARKNKREENARNRKQRKALVETVNAIVSESDPEIEDTEDTDPLPDGSTIQKDDWVAVAFDNGWFPGQI